MQLKGRVNKFFPDRGFGFLAPSSGGSVFFHHSQLPGKGYKVVEEDTLVLFELERDPFKEDKTNAVRIQYMTTEGRDSTS